jgi:chemotaxis protein CheD
MEPEASMTDVFLQPGEYFVADATYRIRTLLGSCVSITLWHPAMKIGAMSHFLLASSGRGPGVALDARYGDDVMLLMLKDLRRSGVPLAECKAKIFGGANMFPKQVQEESLTVGKKNGESARALLQAHAIPVLSESLFGVGYRQIIFDIANGDVWSRQIEPVESAIAEQKKDNNKHEKYQSLGGR